MRKERIHANWPLVGLAVMGALVTACGKPPAEPTPASQAEAPATAATPSADAVAAAPVAPAAAEPAATAGSEPEVSTMKVAQAVSSKLGVPVDLRYQIDGDAMTGQPVTVHLAAVPRVAGTNLAVSIKQETGIAFPKNTLTAQTAEMATTYRQPLQLRRTAGGPRELRVLVTMDFPIGTGFSYFSVPLDGAPAPSKQPVDRIQ